MFDDLTPVLFAVALACLFLGGLFYLVSEVDEEAQCKAKYSVWTADCSHGIIRDNKMMEDGSHIFYCYRPPTKEACDW